MMFGSHPFSVENEELAFTPCPAVPSYLIRENGEVSATLLGNIKVTYCFAEKADFIPGNYQIKNMTFTYANGSDIYVEKDHVAGKIAEDIRSGKVVEIYMEAEKIPDTEK